MLNGPMDVPWWLLIVDWVVRIGVAIHIIFRRRPVTASLSWLVVLVFTPVIGIFAYFLVGETRLGKRRAREYERLSKELDLLAVGIWKHQCTDEQETSDEWRPIARLGAATSNFPAIRGNKLSYIVKSEEFLEQVARDIDSATHHVHLLTFIWDVEGRNKAIAEALIRAAGRGVQCRVLVDGVGGKHFFRSALPEQLRAEGVQVVEALPVSPLRMIFARIDLRNHRKLVIIDGRTAYVGSQNITDSTYRSTRFRKTGPWIDASVRIEGPGAQSLALVFLRDWLLDAEEVINDFEPFLPDIPCPDEGSTVQVVPSGPGPSPDTIRQALVTTIYSAREELVMTTPYFVPDDATRMALQSAATRGVSVTLVMPSVSDSILVAAASRSHYLDLLESGVKILHYTKGLLHAKTVTADRRIAIIGSANLDQRSFFLNFEVSLFIYDSDAAGSLRFMQTSYIEESLEITLPEWRNRSYGRIFLDNAAQLLGPLF